MELGIRLLLVVDSLLTKRKSSILKRNMDDKGGRSDGVEQYSEVRMDGEGANAREPEWASCSFLTWQNG